MINKENNIIYSYNINSLSMRKKNGGKVIASGGFGCVFKPALLCNGQTTRDKNKITKLMLKKYAIEEYEDVIKYEDIIKKIPDYKKYFLIEGFHICEPEFLKEEDLQQFKEKCSALPKKDIDKDNINKSLDKLLAINMPDGGYPIDDFVMNNGSYSVLIKVNNSLMDLLLNGIIEMNKLHIYHCDIKDSNILVDNDLKNGSLYTKLIDWGLSTDYNPEKDMVLPKTWKNRPFQFNTPFSIIIFSEKFTEKYSKFLIEEKNGEIKEEDLKNFIKNFIFYWLKERGSGHFKFINSIMVKLFFHKIENNYSLTDKNLLTNKKEKNKYIEKNFTIPYMVNYIYAVLIYYTEVKKDGKVTFRKYLNEVFIKIIDLFGWITCYYPILEIYYENYDTLSPNEMKIYNIICNVFIKYLYQPTIKTINIRDLINELKSLNPLFNKEEHLQFKSTNVLSRTMSKSKQKKSSFSKTRKLNGILHP